MRTRTRRDPDAEPVADPEAAREAALKLLERTRRTRSDLARRLHDKGFAAPAVASFSSPSHSRRRFPTS